MSQQQPNYRTFTVVASATPSSRAPLSEWWEENWAYISNLNWGRWLYILFSYAVVGFGVLVGPYLILCLATKRLLGSSLLYCMPNALHNASVRSCLSHCQDVPFALDKNIIFWILVYVGIQSYKTLTDMQKLIFKDESSLLDQITKGIVEVINAWKGNNP